MKRFDDFHWEEEFLKKYNHLNELECEIKRLQHQLDELDISEVESEF